MPPAATFSAVMYPFLIAVPNPVTVPMIRMVVIGGKKYPILTTSSIERNLIPVTTAAPGYPKREMTTAVRFVEYRPWFFQCYLIRCDPML